MKNNKIPAYTVKSEVISADTVPTDPVCCPKCKGTTYLPEGYFRKAFTSEIVNGVEVKGTLDDDILMVMDATVCPTCQIRWCVKDKVIYKLYKGYRHLQTQLANGNSSLAEPLIPAGWVN
jgi:predicted  nucleic acid-binding Zn ribbon protein